MRTRLRLASLACLVLLLIAGASPGGYARVTAAAKLADLKSVDELKTLFNRDASKVRLVLLVSPT